MVPLNTVVALLLSSFTYHMSVHLFLYCQQDQSGLNMAGEALRVHANTLQSAASDSAGNTNRLLKKRKCSLPWFLSPQLQFECCMFP